MTRLSTTEYVVLGLIADAPTHGFAISKQLGPDGEVGRAYTVRRPLVYRAMDRLADMGLVEPIKTEPGDAGPQRVVHRITNAGRSALEGWLTEPVGHVRDVRLGFLVKLTILLRAGRSPLPLIRRQRSALAPMLEALREQDETALDPVESWRRHTAVAVGAYLADMERIHADEGSGTVSRQT